MANWIKRRGVWRRAGVSLPRSVARSIRIDASGKGIRRRLDQCGSSPGDGGNTLPVNAWTISGWFYFHQVRSSAWQFFLGAENALSSADEYLAVGWTNGGDSCASHQSGTVNFSTAIPTGEWVFVAATCGPNTNPTYRDFIVRWRRASDSGFPAAQTVTFGLKVDVDPVWHFVWGNDGYEEWCDCSVAQPRLWSATLSEAELLAESQSPRKPARTSNIYAHASAGGPQTPYLQDGVAAQPLYPWSSNEVNGLTTYFWSNPSQYAVGQAFLWPEGTPITPASTGGNAVEWSASLGSELTGSFAIDVPDDADYALIFVDGWENSAPTNRPFTNGSVSIGGTAATFLIANDDDNTHWANAAFGIDVRSLRGTRTFAWSWQGTGNISSGVRACFAYYKGVQQAIPVRGSAQTKWSTNPGNDVEGSVVAPARLGDRIVAHSVCYSATAVTPSGGTLTGSVNVASTSGGALIENAAPTADTTVSVDWDWTTDGDGALIAVVLKREMNAAAQGDTSLAASVSSTATGSAALTTSIPLAASASSTATASADLTKPGAALASSVTGTATGSAALTTSVRLASSVSSAATGAAAVTTAISLVAGATGDAFTGTNGSAPDTSRWENTWGNYAQIQSNTLELSEPSCVTALATFAGDFDVQVDFAEVSAAADSWGIQLHLDFASENYALYAAAILTPDRWFQRGYYFNSAWSYNMVTGRTNTSGKLRIVRSGTTVNVQVADGAGAWQNADGSLLANVACDATDVTVRLKVVAWNSADATAARFDNFTINAGGVFTPSAVATGTAALTNAIGLAASVSGTATGTAVLTTSVALATSVSASATGTADLTAPGPQAGDLDTREKRASAFGFNQPWLLVLPVADNTLSVYDLHQLLGLYAGYGEVTAAALEANAVGTATGSATLTTSIPLAASVTATATSASTLTSNLSLIANVSGTATGAASVTSALRFATSVSGVATGAATLTTATNLATAVVSTATAAATLSTGLQLTSAVSGVATVAADLSTGVSLVAAAASTATAVASVTNSLVLAANVQGTATATADLTAPGQAADLRASVSGTATGTATLTSSIQLVANIASTATADATITGFRPLAANIAGTATATDTLTTSIPLTANISGTATAAASVTTTPRLVANISGTAASTAAVTTGVALAANVSGTATSTAALTNAIGLVSNVSSTATAVAILTTPGQAAELLGNISGTATSAATVTTSIRLAANVSGTATAAATPTTDIRLATAVSSAATSTANLTAPAGLAASVSGTAAAVAAVTNNIRLVTAISSTATATATLTKEIPLAANVSGAATSAATLTTAVRMATAVAVTAVAATDLTTNVRLASAVSSTASASTNVVTGVQLYGAANIVANNVATLTTQIPLAASISSVVDVWAIVRVPLPVIYDRVELTDVVVTFSELKPISFGYSELREPAILSSTWRSTKLVA